MDRAAAEAPTRRHPDPGADRRPRRGVGARARRAGPPDHPRPTPASFSTPTAGTGSLATCKPPASGATSPISRCPQGSARDEVRPRGHCRRRGSVQMTGHSTLDPSFDTHFPSPDAVRSLQMQVRAYAAQRADTPLAPVRASSAASRRRTTSRSTSSTAASATPTCTRPATSGAARDLPDACPATRSSAASRAVGAHVTKFKVGDLAGVGCMVDSCRTCPSCREADLEQYCDEGADAHLQRPRQATGRADLRRLLRDASSSTSASSLQDPRRASTRRPPRRCSAPASPPTRRCGTGRSAPGQKVGVVGLGGLGHMGVKFADALGAPTSSLFTTSPGKDEDAQRLGAARGRRLEATRTR